MPGQPLRGRELAEMIHPDIELVHHRAGADGVGRLRAAGCAVEHEGGVLVDEHGHRQVVVIADAVLRAQDAQPLRRPAQKLLRTET